MPTSEIQYVRQALSTFIAWSTLLVKLVSDELWMMFMDEWSFSLGHGSAYGFLESHSIHDAKDRRVECQHYIQTGTPQWIEVKWFGDGTPLDIKTMTTIHKKWAAYFLRVKNIQCRKL
ncbi:hypothetical protein glysoja_049418 [Glycine soja]|uniref:Uncharacterized protein n=1 Tax=Glycine soja TaxID=3848 RepID=A0A0B2RMQ3_GLYSO|nr:hypothetical protein glysoja_049418 [Glycine soja]